MGDVILELRNIRKNFSGAEVLNGISLTVSGGEFITLLGPSGCGKTTLLRIIAGLESPEEGTVILEGRNVTELPPNRRNVNTVFQNYALFPHMNVAQNISYGLKLRKMPRDEVRRSVTEALRMVQLEGYEARMPSQLSGGQRQRVAIARAIVGRPGVLLLDEPLGALDLQLRRKMQWELKTLQKQLGMTFLYITHDQEEALNMSDRIAVMRGGFFEQVGTPEEIYNRPKTSYVAEFVGEANILRGKVLSAEEDSLLFSCGGGQGRAGNGIEGKNKGDSVAVAVRSESVEFTEDPDAEGIPAVVTEKNFAGGMLRITFQLQDGTHVIASRHGICLPVEPGQQKKLFWRPEDAVTVEDCP